MNIEKNLVLERHVIDNDAHDKFSVGSEFIYKFIDEPSTFVSFQGDELSGRIQYDSSTGLVRIYGSFKNHPNQGIEYLAASPLHRNYSYSGSGLPYPNAEVAYQDTVNKGIIQTDSAGSFSFVLLQPSAYYVRQGKILLKPHVNIKPQKACKVFTVTISEIVPNRSLKNLPDRPNRSEPRS